MNEEPMPALEKVAFDPNASRQQGSVGFAARGAVRTQPACRTYILRTRAGGRDLGRAEKKERAVSRERDGSFQYAAIDEAYED